MSRSGRLLLWLGAAGKCCLAVRGTFLGLGTTIGTDQVAAAPPEASILCRQSFLVGAPNVHGGARSNLRTRSQSLGTRDKPWGLRTAWE
jgi:hypothetical protein